MPRFDVKVVCSCGKAHRTVLDQARHRVDEIVMASTVGRERALEAYQDHAISRVSVGNRDDERR